MDKFINVYSNDIVYLLRPVLKPKLKMLRYEKSYLSLKIKIGGKKNPRGHKTLKVAKNNEFTCLGWFISVVVKNHKKSMYEFNLESVFSFILLQRKV